MKQKTRLLKLVIQNPGLTATGYTRLLGFPPRNPYKPATILRELHRFVALGALIRRLEHGMISGTAWRFYSLDK